MSSTKVSSNICKKRLTVTWFTGAGIVFVLLLFQTIFGHYAGSIYDAWGWFLPTVVPTLSMVIGVLIADTIKKKKVDIRVDKFIYRLALYLSMFYFFIIILTIVLQPFSSLAPVKLLNTSNLWLGPLQGLAAASLGAFFREGAD